MTILGLTSCDKEVHDGENYYTGRCEVECDDKLYIDQSKWTNQYGIPGFGPTPTPYMERPVVNRIRFTTSLGKTRGEHHVIDIEFTLFGENQSYPYTYTLEYDQSYPHQNEPEYSKWGYSAYCENNKLNFGYVSSPDGPLWIRKGSFTIDNQVKNTCNGHFDIAIEWNSKTISMKGQFYNITM